MSSPRRRLARPRSGALLFILVLSTACEGEISGPLGMGSPTGGPGVTGSGSGGSSTTGGPAAACTNATTPAPGRSPLRRLNRAEYKSTVHDLLGVDASIADTLPPDNTGLGFTNNADVLSVTNLLAEAYMTASETLAHAAVASMTSLLPCDPKTAGEDTCAKQFISDFGLRAFRRPLTTDESTSFF